MEPRRARVGAVVAVVAVAFAAGATLVALRWRERPAPYASLTPSVTPSPSAFVVGGAPEHGGPAVRALFTMHLPAWTLALDRAASHGAPGGDHELAVARARVEATAAALGERTARAVIAVLDAGLAATDAERPFDDGERALGVASRALNEALVADGLGYWIDAGVLGSDQGPRQVYVSDYAVERVDHFAAGAQTVRTIEVRRLDRLNVDHALLGLTSAQLRDGVVFLDHVDRFAVRTLGTALADDGTVTLVEGDDTHATWAHRLEQRAGSKVRADFAGMPEVRALGAPFARRHRIFEQWALDGRARGLAVVDPGSYQLDLDALAPLRTAATDPTWKELEALYVELGAEPACRAFVALERRVASSVQRHEAQHRIDGEAGRIDAPATELERRLPRGQSARWVRAVRAETSAYLAQLARAEGTGTIELTSLVSFLFSPPMRGTPEARAALVILEGLGKETGELGPSLVEEGQVVLERVADAYLQLSSTPPDALREAAARLWKTLYGLELSKLEHLDPR